MYTDGYHAARSNHRTFLVAICLLLGGLPLLPVEASSGQGDCRTFPETGKIACGKFLQYWQAHGGLVQQGLPISDELVERSETDGKSYSVQYFERAVFEQHPENAPPYDVLLSLLGRFEYKSRYGTAGAPNQKVSTDNAIKFTQTGHSLGGKFRTYWESHGGLPQQGYPITDEFQEVSKTNGKTYTVQYFERAVFELHPENQAPNDVLLSLLGVFSYKGQSLDYPGVTDNVALTGAGATFPEPLITKWGSEYNKSYGNVYVNYQGIGSGSGRTQFVNKTVDFAATDLPMSDAQFQQAGGPDKALHIPLTIGAVAVTYNLAYIDKPLRLTGPLIADIFLCKVKKWNDPAIAALNPDAPLKDTEILPLYYGFNTTLSDTFTDYLSRVSEEWRTKVGRSLLPTWPCGFDVGSGDGNPFGKLKNFLGGIEYLDIAGVKAQGLKYALIQNKAGNFVDASNANLTASADAVAQAGIPDDLRYSLTDAPGANSYPIAFTNWALVYTDQPDREKSRALAYFLWWATHEGQGYAEKLYYAPLPRSIVRRDEEQIRKMTCGGIPCIP